MCADKESCAGWESCCMRTSHGDEGCRISLNSGQKARIDSLLGYYMEYYHVDLDYSYEVVRSDDKLYSGKKSTIFDQKLDPGLPGQYQLRINFPGKNQFLLSEMTGVFITSMLLILALIAIFITTIRALLKNELTLKRTTDFVNNMTHELNTPIANISLALSGLIKPSATEERKSTYASIIKSENDRLKTQVARLMDITKLEESGLCIQQESVDMHRIIAGHLEVFSMLAAENGGSLTSSLKADQFIVRGDETLLSNIISNLLDNALKYTTEKPEISIDTFNKHNMLVIRVKDNGRGIPESEHKLIFEKFYRVSNGDVHDIKGFGIGLTYVKKVVDAHKGTISVESEPGKGSIFTVKLPL